ncbi:ATPase associated with various cellular activities AAA_3 [Haloterrigena turkmenica DSM 5511]|uniref:ATPase associated with various cellular activities AAA_3 n=1 Tax=Haloterrigena turkmenica (strain ATCC 51198 / DSM 5511 / JCM 9101 / NCIMB 13204 / VKM B-1734 / 4k) TaxID=543526 RepID=D2RR18_HALTV|nr:MoxR family ATPase [Haloterrigena turkmenica]ADB62414.1 ATPase associated with various cellular activities AAA_3 [Haloterrigena turkmenica DSM 5511]
MDESNVTPADAEATVRDVVGRIEEAAVVDHSVLYAVLSAVFARGHVLLEDVPGTGKSVIARTIAESMGLEFTRIQFTPDLLPSDVSGSTVYDEHSGEFAFSEGPVFANVVLADEINRAPPKTQASLLEAMEERQVSVDGTTYDLPEPFVVVATQNPIEQEGTFRLPEAQRDRFSVKTSLGYPDVDGEMGLLERRANRRTLSPSVESVTDPDAVRAIQDLTEDVTVDEKIRRYIIELARATRRDGHAEIGVSPRGVQRVFEAARAAAVIDGRSYVAPDDVKRLAEPTMAHRIVLTTEASVEGVAGGDIVRRALRSVGVPAVSPDTSDPDGDDPGSEPPADGDVADSSSDPEDGASPADPSSDDSSDDPDATWTESDQSRDSDGAIDERSPTDEATRADDDSPWP